MSAHHGTNQITEVSLCGAAAALHSLVFRSDTTPDVIMNQCNDDGADTPSELLPAALI